MNFVVSRLLHGQDSESNPFENNNNNNTEIRGSSCEDGCTCEVEDPKKSTGMSGGQTNEENNTSDDEVGPVCCSNDPVKNLERLQKMGAELEKEEQSPGDIEATAKKYRDQKKILRMSLNTALAISLHNFPEGIATFVAALNDTKVGLIFAIAIAIHNIPEGLCVALPVFYATGSRRKAFIWAMVPAISEPIAALIGWLILASVMTDTTFGVLFGIVSGMMTIISVRELLPTAHRYDPDDIYVTYFFIGGMTVMALSLVLFLF